IPTVRISSSTTGAGRPVAPGPAASPVRPSRRRGAGRSGGSGGAIAPGGPPRPDPTRDAARTRPPAGPGGEDREAPPAHRGHRPSRLVLLSAATVTVVVAAIFFVPKVREEDAPVDRTVDTYTVTLGDTISSVAQLHGTTKEAVQEAN